MTTESWNALPTQVLEIHYLSCATKFSSSAIFFHSYFSLKVLLSFPSYKNICLWDSQWLAPTEIKMSFFSFIFPHLAQMQGLKSPAVAYKKIQGIKSTPEASSRMPEHT